MANFTGNLPLDFEATAFDAPFPGRVAAAYRRNAGDPTPLVDDPAALDDAAFEGLHSQDGAKTVRANVNHTGATDDRFTTAFDFFEKWHIIDRSYDFGQVLSTQTQGIEVFNAFRKLDKQWTAFVNNAGVGTTLLNLPGLPTTVANLQSFSPDLTIEVTTAGQPFVDTTLDFTLETTGTIMIPIMIQRLVLFGVRPQVPWLEELEFLTEVMLHKVGTEQRHSLRKNPRQFLNYRFRLEDGPERARIDNLLFGFQDNLYGVPIWDQETELTVAATATDTTITVDSTAFADFRVGGVAVIYQDQTTFDALVISSFTATTITFQDPLMNSYAVGVAVMPMAVAGATPVVRGRRWPVNLEEITVRFRVTDNDVSIADTSAFSSFNSKVLLDDCNVLNGTLPETFERQITFIDNETGIVTQTGDWTRNKHGSPKTFVTNTKQGKWEHRQLMHALRGRQISFYLPTFVEDITPNQPLASGSNTMSIVNVGYMQFVVDQQPHNVIRVVFNDGTAPLIRTITSSSIVDATTETLTLDAVWPSTFALSVIERVEYVEEVRFDSDTIRIQHELGGSAKFIAPTKAVFD